MNISIEKANVGDVAEIIFDIVKRTFIRNFDPPTKDVTVVKSYLNGCEVYMVNDNSVPIGYFGYKVGTDNSVELKSIALLPSHQKIGIGKQMLQKIFELTKDNKIWLVVHPQNTQANMTYLKSGFVIVNWKSDFFGDGQPRLIMEKE
jgi:ribosomal protein S18 acetylase RimI-like enzyme